MASLETQLPSLFQFLYFFTTFLLKWKGAVPLTILYRIHLSRSPFHFPRKNQWWKCIPGSSREFLSGIQTEPDWSWHNHQAWQVTKTFLHLVVFLTAPKFPSQHQCCIAEKESAVFFRRFPQISPVLWKLVQASFLTQSSLFSNLRKREYRSKENILQLFSMATNLVCRTQSRIT